TPRKGTVTLDGTSSALQLLSGGQRFNALTINGSAGTYTLADHLTASGTLALTNGTLDASSTGNFTVRAGTINQTSGIFTPRSGTVILTSSADATATITSTLNTLRIEDSSESGLVGYWKFDEGTNTGAILDSSGYGNTGVRRGGAGKIWSGSSLPSLQFENRYAMQFDGVDDYVEIPYDSTRDFGTSNFTINTWIRIPSQVNMPIIEWGTYYDNGFLLRLNEVASPSISIYIGNTGYAWTKSFTANTWYHLVVLRESSTTMHAYVDGVSLGTITIPSNATITANGGVTRLGKYTSGATSSLWNGLLDDVRIYNRALSANEVANLARGRYAAGNASTSTFTLGANLSTATLAIDSG
ncbi:MAG: LamG domain-containing protein, partial [Patescibacteria group bacterium]